MASYDITETVNRILALGGTEAQILGCADRVVKFSDTDWTAQNRRAADAVHALLATLEAASAKRDAAAATIEQVKAGTVLYTKTSDGTWLIWGREDVVTDGATVTATRRDGTTTTVVVTETDPVREREGLRYRTAQFRAPRTLEADPIDGMTGPAAEALRIGRSYGVDGQVWDNA